MGITLGLLLGVLKLNFLLFIEPLPYPEQEKLFVAKQLTVDQNDKIKSTYFNYRSLLNLYQNQSVFTGSAITYYSWNLVVDHPQQPLVNTLSTSPEYFKLFDVPMTVGRGFEKSEAIENKVPVAVISYNSWKNYFDLRDDILQQKINLGDIHYQIIGVISQQFIEPNVYQMGRDTDIWLPWDVEEAWYKDDSLIDYPYAAFNFIGKLSHSASLNQAEFSLSKLMEKPVNDGNNLNVSTSHWRAKVQLAPLKSVVLGNTESVGLLLLLATIGLLMIVSANIINLFISHIVEKTHQMAVHAAIGAKNNQLFLMILSEIFILIFFSGLISLVVANATFNVMQNHFYSVLPRVDELRMGLSSWSSMLLIVVMLALGIASLSSNAINQRNLNLLLLTSGKGTRKQVPAKVRNGLIAIQVAIAAILVFANVALFLQAIKPVIEDKGINFENVFELYLTPHNLPFESAEKRIALTHEIKRKLLERPEIKSITHSNLPIVLSSQISSTLNDEGETIQFTSRRVDHHYFELVEQRLMQGNNFTLEDIRNRNRALTGEIEKNLNQVAIVNQNLAKRLNNDSDVIGMLINVSGDTPSRIIGVVKDSLITSSLTSQPRVFTPSTEAAFSYLIKFNSKQSLTREELVSLVTSVTSLYAPYGYESTHGKFSNLLFVHNTSAIVTALLAVMVLLLATIGIYGVISYGVQMRRFEFGTRLALGAKRRILLVMLLKENLMPISSGIVVGLFILLVSLLGVPDVLMEHKTMPLLFAFVLMISLIGLTAFTACLLSLRRIVNRPVVHSLSGSD